MDGLGPEWIGTERIASARSGLAGKAWRGSAWRGRPGTGMDGPEWQGLERRGTDGRGLDGRGRIGTHRSGPDRMGGGTGEDRLGAARTGPAGVERRGLAWSGKHWLERRAMHSNGSDRLGPERRGRSGSARTVLQRHGTDRQARKMDNDVTQKFAWREGFRAKVKAEVFAEEVVKIAGEIELAKPEDVLAAASKRGSKLRVAFTWDDAKAAHKYRLEQASGMLGALQIIRVESRALPPVSQKAYHVVSTEHGRGFMPAARISGNDDYRLQVLRTARRELESYLSRYLSVVAMGPHIPALQSVHDEMKAEIERLTEASSKPQKKAASRKPRQRIDKAELAI